MANHSATAELVLASVLGDAVCLECCPCTATFSRVSAAHRARLVNSADCAPPSLGGTVESPEMARFGGGCERRGRPCLVLGVSAAASDEDAQPMVVVVATVDDGGYEGKHNLLSAARKAIIGAAFQHMGQRGCLIPASTGKVQ